MQESREKGGEKNVGFHVRLSYKTNILTIEEERQDNKKGGKVEECLCEWKSVEVTYEGRYRYGGQKRDRWREKKQFSCRTILENYYFECQRKEIGQSKVEESSCRWRNVEVTF